MSNRARSGDFFAGPESIANAIAVLCTDLPTSVLVDDSELTESIRRAITTRGFIFSPSRGQQTTANRFDEDAGSAADTRSLASECGLRIALCIDTLQKFHHTELAERLLSIHERSEPYAIVATPSLPSQDYNRLHRTLLPQATWKQLLVCAGLRLVRSIAIAVEAPAIDPLESHWRKHAPFFGESPLTYEAFLVERRPALDALLAREKIASLLDLQFRKAKRAQFQGIGDKRVVFNLHHVQDYFFFRPLLDVLDAEQVTVVTRNGSYYPKLQMECVRSALRREDINTICYDRCDDIPWSRLRGAHLISATEGTIWYNQSLAHQIVAAAKLNGCPTTVLQHGITNETFRNHFYCFASDAALTWGNEAREGLEGRFHDVMGLQLPWGSISTTDFKPIGGPKFTDSMFEKTTNVVASRLAVPEGKFKEIVLFGAKSRRGYEADVHRFTERLQRLARDRNDRLFIVKTHPSNTASVFADVEEPNILFIDEAHCIAADISLARLITDVDVVASSLSTLLLDGAVAGKRLHLYETGQSLSYKYLKAAPLEDIASEDLRGEATPAETAAFLRHYADAVDPFFYRRFAEYLKAAGDPEPFPDSAALSLSLASDVEYLWAASEGSRAQHSAQLETLTSEQRRLEQEWQLACARGEALRFEAESWQMEAKRLEQANTELGRQLSSIREQLLALTDTRRGLDMQLEIRTNESEACKKEAENWKSEALAWRTEAMRLEQEWRRQADQIARATGQTPRAQ